MIKIISWNINSLRLRLPLLAVLVKQLDPDIVLLQETKVRDEDFPLFAVRQLGFEYIEFSGEKSYNGVAILSKIKLKNIQKLNILEANHKRHISGVIETEIGEIIIHNFYVPAGGDIPDPKLNDKFLFKLNFMDWMIKYFSSNYKNQKIIMAGDINIAPLEHDVWSHKQLLNVVSHTEIEVKKMQILQETIGFIDSHRLFTAPHLKLYSWWSYRALDPIKSNRGRRLDHIWTSPNIKSHIKIANIYQDFRLFASPSDHVPIEIVINNASFE